MRYQILSNVILRLSARYSVCARRYENDFIKYAENGRGKNKQNRAKRCLCDVLFGKTDRSSRICAVISCTLSRWCKYALV
jgi:hypothetical protein